MKGTWLTFYIFCFFSLNTVGQTNIKIEDAYVDYFKLSRESLYVHLNKTTFLIGEDIWLKCYAYNRRKKQSFKNTSNIYVGIYDSKGKQIKKKLLLAKNGTANGNFLIDTTYTSGVYYIKASTNWMRNFNEDDAFVQKIVILDNNYKQETQKANTYDLQFLPEGGHIVNQTKNTIGYKIIDNNGNGVKAKAILYDSENEEIASFESNNFGLGKFTLWPNINESYTVVFTLLNGEKLKKILPKPKTEGIALTIDNSKANEIIISINTNNATLTKIKQQKFKIAIHKEGDMKTLPFTFENSTRKSLAINKDILFDGVNTITLINENNTPINERLFYNYKTPKFNSIFVSKLNESKDSISLSIYQNTYKSNNLSISILPETSTSYNPNHNIISANLLQPYLKGFIETPSYYFSNITSKKKEDLDLLLLTQGWSRYNWNSVINYKAEANYNFEQGIKLKGSVISNFTEVDSLYLYSTVNYPAQFVTLDKDKKFTINNFYVLENETLKFSYVNKRMKFLKPNLHITYNVFDEIDSLNKGILEAHQIHIPITTNEHLNRFKNDTISLNEILLSSKKKLVDKIEPFNFSFKNNTKVFDEKAGLTYPDVVSYIRINGYKVSQSFGKVVIQSRVPNSISGEQYPTPSIYLGDVLLQDFNVLYELPTANIKKIYIDKRGLGQGMAGGSGGVIRIYMKENSVFDIKTASKTSNTYLISEPSIGFASAKAFYAPKYNSYNNSTFLNYGVIGWFPNIELIQNKSSIIKFLNTQTKSINLYIEGVAENGDLISEFKTLTIN